MIITGDCRAVMAGMDEASVDAIVCDPPYGLEFMGKDWDRPWAVSATNGVGYAGRDDLQLPSHRDNRNANCRTCGGRQRGKKRCTCPTPDWDRDPRSDMRDFQDWSETWAREALRVLKPGGHLLAFGGTRTFHRMTVAIEDAGFEIRDCLSWLYGQGFPKSLDVSKAIDKMAGAEREVIGFDEQKRKQQTGQRGTAALNDRIANDGAITAPATPEAAQWAGWGTALKPAHEPVIVARKPADIRYNLRSLVPMIEEQLCKVDSFAKTDTHLSELLQASGYWSIASWLRGCLAALLSPESKYTTETATALITDLKTLRLYLSEITPSCTTQGATEPNGIASSVWCAVAISTSVVAKCERLVSTTAGESATDPLADQATDRVANLSPNWEPVIVARKPLIGTVAANVLQHGTGAINVDACRIGLSEGERPSGSGNGQRGTLAHGDRNPLAGGSITPDSGRWPANVALDETAAAMLDAQSGERPSRPARYALTGEGVGHNGASGATYQHGGSAAIGYQDTGGPSRFFYCAKSSRRERNAGLEGMPERMSQEYGQYVKGRSLRDGEWVETGNESQPKANHHPTVKPIALMRWLVRLVTPPGGTVLDPFAGSGSTGCAAVLEGFAFIGIEMDPTYAEIARRRIAYWATQRPTVLQPALPLEGVAD